MRTHENDSDEGLSITRTKEINISHLSSLAQNKPLSNFDIIEFIALNNGRLLGRHAVLFLGTDERTGTAIVLDPSIGKRAFVSLHGATMEGLKTLSIKYEGSQDNDPYWSSYRDYGQLIITRIISVKLK
jgi:hypothetical protein